MTTSTIWGFHVVWKGTWLLRLFGYKFQGRTIKLTW